MDVRVVRDVDELAVVGADLVAGWLANSDRPSLLAALGQTPLGIYAELARRRAEGRFDTSRLRLIQLDAYLGLAIDDPRSLSGWLTRAVVEPLGIPEDRVIRLPGDAPDPAEACRAYDAAVAAAGGVDVAILGLGPNGHLGFNEPPSDATAATREVPLAEASIDSNGRYWGGPEQVPARALTAGMSLILSARHPLLVVAGPHKREILEKTLYGPIAPDVPASFLRPAPAAVVLADRAALGDREAALGDRDAAYGGREAPPGPAPSTAARP